MFKSKLKDLLGNLPCESGFKKRMRLHQAWWRAFVLGEEPGFHPIRKKELLGSTIKNGESSGKNFLTENAWKAAQATIKERLEYGGGLMEENRLFNNLLSSQPLCFNFFGELKMDYELGLKILQRFFPGITGLQKVIFEFAPRENYLDDNSAFDIAFFVERGSEKGLIGLECKYTDTFSKKEYDREEYREIFQRSHIFKHKYSRYKASRFNQLFRNQLLAESMLQYQQIDFVYTGLFCHQDDHPALKTGEMFSQMLAESAVFQSITYQDFIEKIQILEPNWGQREWTMMLWARYVSTRLNCLVD